MNWRRGKYIIDCDLEDILYELSVESGKTYFSRVSNKSDYVLCSCPFHKDGAERHPSLGIVSSNDTDKEFGVYHCFTCGSKGPLELLVARVLGCETEDAIKWLQNRFGLYAEEAALNINLEPIETQKEKPSIKSQKPLNLDYTHPYLLKRHLDLKVCKRFGVGYDKDTGYIVFPVYDDRGRFCFYTRRSVYGKKFIIDKNAQKPVYLLNEVLRNNCSEVYICESQINALTLWSWGYPAVALFGTGSSDQYKILNKASSILKINLCLDGDNAGKSGTLKLIKNLSNRFFIDVVEIPRGKDVNDLTKEEFDSLRKIDSIIYK